MKPAQGALFPEVRSLPPGFVYREEFLSPAEERDLIAGIARLPLAEARYREWTARRRTVSYGGSYDFTHHRLDPADPVPPLLLPLRERIAAWSGIEATLFSQALVAEYAPGTPLGWHRDVPDFEFVAGVSLAGHARMRFRPYPPAAAIARATHWIDLAPRSAYQISGQARWEWQHAVSPTRQLRYSVTFRTRRL